MNIIYYNVFFCGKNVFKKRGEIMIFVDVRSKQEYEEGHLNGAINIPLYDIGNNVSTILKDKKEEIIVYCKSGVRSKKAKKKLENLGYMNVKEIEGGLDRYCK